MADKLKVETWANKLEKKLQWLDTTYIWQSQSKIDANNIFKWIKDRCNFVEWQNVF
jgi:hypothetical protein